MNKTLFWAALSSTFLAACGGGTEPEAIEAVAMSRAALILCPAARSSRDETMLACLAGTSVKGKDGVGNDCSVSFTREQIAIAGKDYKATIALPLSANAGFKDTYFAYSKEYTPRFDSLDFSVRIGNGRTDLFDFLLVHNVDTGRDSVVIAVDKADGSDVNAIDLMICTAQL